MLKDDLLITYSRYSEYFHPLNTSSLLFSIFSLGCNSITTSLP
uniref:Uncharacterized protein n=1 Tax=virus sp. ctML55 TaxID=2827627 RepID=A0A8S5RI11_9VIRU|nr:MAG TPA: hypothetical protein [virus sp. ctML55]